MSEPTDAEREALRAFIEAMTSLTRASQTHVPLQVLGDALHSAGAVILTKLYGPALAAERLRQAADLVEMQDPEVSH